MKNRLFHIIGRVTILFLVFLLLAQGASAVANTWTIGSGGDAWSSASSGDNTVQNKGNGHINVGQLADDYSDNNHDMTLFGFSAGDVTVAGGVLQISNGSASTNTHRVHYTDLNITNASIYYNGKITAGEYIGNIFRLNDAGNWYSNWYDINDNPETKSHYRVYTPSATFGTDSNTSTDMVVGTMYALKQKSCGSTFTNYINGTLEDTETNTTLTDSGYVGYTFSSSGGVGTIQVDDIRVLPLDSSCNEITSGNRTVSHNQTDGNVTHQIVVNATTPENTNYSVYYRLNNTGDFINLASNQTGNQTIAITTQYQNTDVRVQLFGNETATPEINSITYYSQAEEESTSAITIPTNSWGMFNNWSVNTNFSSIVANESNDVAYTFYNVTSGEWDSYYSGYSWNADQTLDKNYSVMGFFNAQTTITANTVTPWNTSITEGWNMLYLMGTTNKTLTEICTNMVNCTDIYYYNSTTNDYVSTGTDTIQPNQGFLAYVNQTGTWIRSTI